MPIHTHAVSRLRSARLARSVKPFLARGGPQGERCVGCRLVPSHCMCALRPMVPTQAGVCLLMADIEPLKPSNTGWLIADVVANTFFWLGAHGGRPGALGALGRPAVAALCGVSGGVCGRAQGGDAAARVRSRASLATQAPTVCLARRHLARGAQDVSQKPLPIPPARAQPAKRSDIAVQAAPLHAR